MNRPASIVVFLGCLATFSCKPKPAPPTPPVAVNLMTVTAQPVTYYDKYPSTTVAVSQVSLTAQVTGYITAINFTEGSHVHKGQLLYKLDERLYQAAVDQARAALRVDSGNLRLVQQDADRYAYLAKYKAIATQLVDHVNIQLQNAKDSVVAAQQQLKTALTNLSYSKIYAPFDGTIGISQVRIGNLASAGTTVLNTISTDNPMAVDFLVNEKQLPHFEQLQAQKGRSIDSLFTIQLPDGELYPYPGKILFIDRAVDPQTGAIDIRLTFPNPDYILRPGMSTVVRVHNQDAAPQVVVPSRAVVEQMGEYFVFVAKDTIMRLRAADSAEPKGADTARTPEWHAFQKKVQLGETVGPNVVIKSGVEPGERIVVDGVQAIHEGSRINASPVRRSDGPDKASREADSSNH
ncbi:MAG TPA: efflux RND transporter periplasmic adaptor subunit [Puia sp.]|nr:efflux RND transporter periplasmic adaptor subunit [Puia sp.]